MISSSYPRSAADGAGSYVRALSQALVKRGYSVTVVAPHDPSIVPWDTQGVDVRRFRYAPAERMHVMGHGRSLKADRRLRAANVALLPCFATAAVTRALALHKQAPFDVIHGHWAVPGGPVAALVSRRTGCPLVLTLHGSDVFIAQRNRLYGAAARFAFNRASSVAGVSQDLLDRACTVGLEPAKASLAPCGVDTDYYAIGDGTALRESLGIPPDAPVIGSLGRLVAKKGFAHLIEATALLAESMPKLVCVVGGEGDLKQELASLAEQRSISHHVMLPGNIPWHQTPDFYAMCDVVAVPSIIDDQGNVDGLPNVLVEAMASGRPIVGSDLVGIGDTIADGEDGLLVTPGDANQLADACARLLQDDALALALGRAARSKMIADYTWAAISGKYITLYRDALDA